MVSAKRVDPPAGDGASAQALTLRIDGRAALSMAAVHAVETACAGAEQPGAAAAVSVLVAGSPSGSWTADANVALVSKWERALRRLERLDATTVAVASGSVGGAALEVLLATDYRIGGPDLRLCVSFDHGATWPGMATYRLTVQAGIAAARRAVLFGHPMEVAEALAVGLVHEVAEEPQTRLAEVAAELAALPGKELAIRRRLMHDAGTTSFEDALGAHLAACDRELRRTSSAGVAP
jgi:isomerase DpgB